MTSLDPRSAAMTNSSAVLTAALPYFADGVFYKFILLNRILLLGHILSSRYFLLPLWNLPAQVFENSSPTRDLWRSMPFHMPSARKCFLYLIHLLFLLVSKTKLIFFLDEWNPSVRPFILIPTHLRELSLSITILQDTYNSNLSLSSSNLSSAY